MDERRRVVNRVHPSEFVPSWRCVRWPWDRHIPVEVDLLWSDGRRTTATGTMQAWQQVGEGSTAQTVAMFVMTYLGAGGTLPLWLHPQDVRRAGHG
jgi:hypothetical protein